MIWRNWCHGIVKGLERSSIGVYPLKPLHNQFSNSNTYIVPERELCLDDYQDYRFELWTSTSAVLWTANRPQEQGIHVHVYENKERIIDDTFGKVVYQGKELNRKKYGRQWLLILFISSGILLVIFGGSSTRPLVNQ